MEFILIGKEFHLDEIHRILIHRILENNKLSGKKLRRLQNVRWVGSYILGEERLYCEDDFFMS